MLKITSMRSPLAGQRGYDLVLRIWRTEWLYDDVYRKINQERTQETKPGRGRKLEPWPIALEIDLVCEFNRLRKLGIKIQFAIVVLIAK